MNQSLLIGTLICAGGVGLFLVLNIIRIVRGKESSKTLTVLLHLSGMGAAVLNMIRVCLLYDSSRGVMAAANVIVLVSLLISMVRVLRGKPEEDENEEDDEPRTHSDA